MGDRLYFLPSVATADPAPHIPITEDEIREDVAAALVDQGYSRTVAKSASIAARGDSFFEMFKSALEFVGRARSTGRPIDINRERETMKPETAAAGRKTCRGFEKECDEPLDQLNRSGLCRRCYGRKHYHEKHGEKSTRKPAAARRRVVQASKVIDRERVALEVTESQLDRFLTKLPIADKQMLANYYLGNF